MFVIAFVYTVDVFLEQIEELNKHLFITAKPMIYLVNMSEKDYIRKKNRWFVKDYYFCFLCTVDSENCCLFNLPLMNFIECWKILIVWHFYRAMHFSAKHGRAISCFLSVRLSVCDVGGLWSHRREILETRKLISWTVSQTSSFIIAPTPRRTWGNLG